VRSESASNQQLAQYEPSKSRIILSNAFLLVEWLYTDTSRHICHVSATWRELQSERTLVELP